MKSISRPYTVSALNFHKHKMLSIFMTSLKVFYDLLKVKKVEYVVKKVEYVCQPEYCRLTDVFLYEEEMR